MISLDLVLFVLFSCGVVLLCGCAAGYLYVAHAHGWAAVYGRGVRSLAVGLLVFTAATVTEFVYYVFVHVVVVHHVAYATYALSSLLMLYAGWGFVRDTLSGTDQEPPSLVQGGGEEDGFENA